MTLIGAGDLVAAAAAAGTGVAAFNVITLEHVEAVVNAATVAHTAVIVAISENAVRFHDGQVLPLAAASAQIARAAPVPVALHLDHVTDRALLEQAPAAGFGSVMFDAGALRYDENVALTADAARFAHDAGLWIEAELGYVGGKASQPQSAHAPGVRTDPDEAADFVRSTGVDALAVAVGSSHAMLTRTATLDHELITALRARLSVPLVLHGSSGVPDDELASAVRAGIAKVNVGTALNVAMTGSIRSTLDADERLVDPRGYLAPAREAISRTVQQVLRVVSGQPGTPSERQ